MSKFEIMNAVELQRLQDGFCAVTNVAACCLDVEGEFISKLSGDEEAKKVVKDFIASDRMKELLSRVEEGSLEDVAIEKIEDLNTMAAVVAVRVKDQTLFYWVVFEVSEDNGSDNFYRILDVLRDTSNIMFENRMSNYKYQSEQQEMSKDLHTIEATTAVVQLLDSDEPTERILDKWVKIIARHMRVDTAQVFCIHPSKTTMDVIAEWTAPGCVSFFDKTRNIGSFDFLDVSKPLVLSTESEWSGEGAVPGNWEYRQLWYSP